MTKDLINKFSFLKVAKYFSSGILQNNLVFIPTKKYIKYFNGSTRIESWKCFGMSEGNIENIENITESDRNFGPTFVDHYLLPDIHFNGRFFIEK